MKSIGEDKPDLLKLRNARKSDALAGRVCTFQFTIFFSGIFLLMFPNNVKIEQILTK
jgi:hypothetical protein